MNQPPVPPKRTKGFLDGYTTHAPAVQGHGSLDGWRATWEGMTEGEAREVLAEDLGLDPSPVLQELERAILRQDTSLAAPEAPTRSTRPLPVPPTPLVGRRLELAA